jgi:hypothetical protein
MAVAKNSENVNPLGSAPSVPRESTSKPRRKCHRTLSDRRIVRGAAEYFSLVRGRCAALRVHRAPIPRPARQRPLRRILQTSSA